MSSLTVRELAGASHLNYNRFGPFPPWRASCTWGNFICLGTIYYNRGDVCFAACRGTRGKTFPRYKPKKKRKLRPEVRQDQIPPPSPLVNIVCGQIFSPWARSFIINCHDLVNSKVSVRWIHVRIKAVFSHISQQISKCFTEKSWKMLCMHPAVIAIPMKPYLISMAVQAGKTHHNAFKHNWNYLLLLADVSWKIDLYEAIVGFNGQKPHLIWVLGVFPGEAKNS